MVPPEQKQFTYNFGAMESASMQPVQMEPVQNFPNLQPVAAAQTIHPYMAPVMAVILPNYPALTPGFPPVYPPPAPSMLPPAAVSMAAVVPGGAHFPPQLFPAQPTPQPQTDLRLLLCSPRASSSVGDEEEEEEAAAAGPPALFSSSRSSSPLQLNLLQEEMPKHNGGQGGAAHNRSESLHDQHVNEVGRAGLDVHLQLGQARAKHFHVGGVFRGDHLRRRWQESRAEGPAVHYWLFPG